MNVTIAEWQPPGSSLWIEVRVMENRLAYGRTDRLITPMAGHGEQWVNGERLRNVQVVVVELGEIGNDQAGKAEDRS